VAFRPPPRELIRSPWLPFIRAFAIRAQRLVNNAPGLTATSWFRSALDNLRARGDIDSQHLFALAADFVGSGPDIERGVRVALALGIVPAPTPGQLHIQLFPAGALARAGVTFPRVA